MSYCETCGHALPANANVCPQCSYGADQSGAAAAALPQSSPGLQPNAAGALAYVAGLVTGILFLVLEPHKSDRFVRFHAFQSIFFNVAWIGFWIAWMILGLVLGTVTHGLFFFIQLPVDLLFVLGGFGLWAYLLYAAWQGKTFRLPFIGALAAKQAGM